MDYWTAVTVIVRRAALMVGQVAALVSGPLAVPLGIAKGLVYYMGTGVRFS